MSVDAAHLSHASARAARAPLPQPGTRWAIFLDVDGCLVEFDPEPGNVRIPPPLCGVLEELHAALGGALALISGRTLADLDRLFAPLALPCAGQYGFERRSADGAVHGALLPDARVVAQIRRACDALRDEFPALRIEDKGVSIALHYRRAPELEPAIARAARAIVAPFAAAFEVQPGSMVQELKPVACNKGTALELFRREAPFRGRVPVFLGDDIADESAFAAVNAAGGASICVGAPRRTVAEYALATPAQARAWLGDVLATLRSRRKRAQ